MAITYDLFSVTKEGFEEHFQVQADDEASVLAGRSALISALLADGAQARPQKGGFNRPASSEPATIDPMVAAAGKVFGAEVSAECPNNCGPMRKVKGTAETGKLSKNGKPYPSFYACNACGHKQNA